MPSPDSSRHRTVAQGLRGGPLGPGPTTLPGQRSKTPPRPRKLCAACARSTPQNRAAGTTGRGGTGAGGLGAGAGTGTGTTTKGGAGTGFFGGGAAKLNNEEPKQTATSNGIKRVFILIIGFTGIMDDFVPLVIQLFTDSMPRLVRVAAQKKTFGRLSSVVPVSTRWRQCRRGRKAPRPLRWTCFVPWEWNALPKFRSLFSL